VKDWQYIENFLSDYQDRIRNSNETKSKSYSEINAIKETMRLFYYKKALADISEGSRELKQN
jgi:hypothetical protein